MTSEPAKLESAVKSARSFVAIGNSYASAHAAVHMSVTPPVLSVSCKRRVEPADQPAQAIVPIADQPPMHALAGQARLPGHFRHLLAGPARPAPPDNAVNNGQLRHRSRPPLHVARKRHTARRPITATVNHVPGPDNLQSRGSAEFRSWGSGLPPRQHAHARVTWFPDPGESGPPPDHVPTCSAHEAHPPTIRVTSASSRISTLPRWTQNSRESSGLQSSPR